MEANIRLSGVIHESLVNGPGLRRVFFSQGCKHNCEGCFNPETHDFDGGFLCNMNELIEDVKDNPMIKGITFSGGDPLEQADKFSYLAKEFKKLGLNIWCYTGYTYEYLINNHHLNPFWKELLQNIDVLVDGKFVLEKKDEGLKFRGSSNQRLVDVQKSLEQREIISLEI